MSIPNDPGQYPGRPSPDAGFMNPQLMPGAPGNQGGSQLTLRYQYCPRCSKSFGFGGYPYVPGHE